MAVTDKTLWRTDIDGLRAIAVLFVVAYHAFPAAVPGGFVGVDIFFVISGYLITGILLREHETGRFSVLRFYGRRARRLFPALAVVLIVVVLAAFFFSHPSQIKETAKLGTASAISMGNVALWRESGYFDGASRLKPLLNLWSLGVEEQFYLIWPLVLAALLRSRLLFAIVIAGCLISFGTAEAFNEVRPAAVFYLPFFRAWELGIGALLAMLDWKGQDSERLLGATSAGAAVMVGVALLFGSALWLRPGTPYPGLSAVAPVIGAAFVIWAGNRAVLLRNPASRVLSSRPLVYIGLISYSLYLWHWPLLSLPATAGVHLDAWSRLALVAVAFALSAATFRWIETPVRHAALPTRAALASSIALLAAGTLSMLVFHDEMRANAMPERQRLADALAWPDPIHDRDSCPGDVSRLTPPIDYCHQSGPPPVRAVVWGDSHADHLFPGLVARDSGRDWLLLADSSCPPTAGIDVRAGQLNCPTRTENVLRWIEQQPQIETVVLGFFGYYAEDSDVAQAHRDGPVGPSKTRIDGSIDRASKIRAFTKGLSDTVGRLIAAHKTVVLVIDVPELPFSPEDCFISPRVSLSTKTCEVPMADVTARQASLREIVSRIATKYPGVRIADPLSVLCDPAGCGPGSKIAPTYRDSHHLSVLGSTKVARLILEAAN